MKPVALLFVLAALGLGACGGQGDDAADFQGAEQEVADTVSDLQEAAAAGDQERLCSSLLAAELTRRAGDCRRVVEQALDDADAFELETVRVRVQGAAATARVRAATGDDERGVTLRFVRDGRNWKLAGV